MSGPWQVRVCPDGSASAYDAPHLRTFHTYTAAKRYAEKRAYEFHYGTVIVDIGREIADWGNEWTLAGDATEGVPPPPYAEGKR